MEQSPQPQKSRIGMIAGLSVILLAVICIAGIVISNWSSEKNPCESFYTQGWLYDADLKGMVTLYEKAAGVSTATIVPVYGIGHSLFTDIDRKCTYGEHVYYHVDLGGGEAGWVPELYIRWSKPRPEGTINIP